MAREITTCDPTIFVVFGATGDLFKRKILPALFSLYGDNLLPKKCKIIAFARRPFSDAEFRKLVSEHWNGGGGEGEKFLSMISYVQGTFDDVKAYENLAQEISKIDEKWGMCSNKLLYLAVPPVYYETIFDNVYASGLSIPCGGNKGWTRILVEKPFGNDLEHAFALEKKLQSYFVEEQIFRIDHYLAKETMQNILSFRFSNPIFEAVWNKKNIAQVAVRLYETNDVASRGGFYDGVGALRDVGQNHALQMLALTLMSRPKSFSCKEIRKERSKVLASLKAPSRVILAQYKGYVGENNVSPKSVTETFFRVETKACGIPVVITSGKALKESRAEIAVTFSSKKNELPNVLTFTLQPHDGVFIRMNMKKPGLEYDVSPADLSFFYKDSTFEKGKDAYVKVLYDAMLGDQTLFASSEEIMSGWRFVKPLLHARSHKNMQIYEKGADPESMIR